MADARTVHVRFRGRVTGPFSKEELIRMARRGQISRMHEVSKDRSNWRRAGTLPELFAARDSQGNITQAVATYQASPQPDAKPQARPDAPQAKSAQQTRVPQQAAPAGAMPQWYYAMEGKEVGPVPQSTLLTLIQRGGLKPDTLVWMPGMPDWQPLAQTKLPGLAK